MTERLIEKHIAVTAAASGIGRAAALAFADEGATVHAVDVHERNLDRLAATHSAVVPHCLDLLDKPAISGLAKSIGTADVLFNCAGFVHAGTILECAEGDWDFSFSLNVKTMDRLSRAFLPGMLRRREGNIINMSSVAGSAWAHRTGPSTVPPRQPSSA